MHKFILAFLLALCSTAAAQQQVLPASTVVGRLGVGPGPAQAIPFSVLSSNLISSGSGIFGLKLSGDVDYAMTTLDRTVLINAALTAPRTVTLFAAAALATGQEICIGDAFGGVTNTNTLTIARAGSDTIAGQTSYVIGSAFGSACLISDGSSKWTFNYSLARMPANTVKCNLTSATAPPQDCSIPSLTPTSTAAFNASGSGTTTTGTISASSNSLALAGAIDFVNGQGIRVNHAGAAFTLGQPTSPTATPQGTTGATTYQYKLSTLDGAGGVGAATTTFQTTTGNATLGATNFNALSWTPPGGSPAGYAVYKSIAGVFTLIGVANGTTFNDYGYTGWSGFVDWIPTVAPGAALADYLVTTISSGAGTTSLTLGATAATTASSQTVTHDDTTALQAALNGSTNVYIPAGTYYTTGTINTQSNATVTGAPWQTTFRGANIGQTVLNTGSAVKISGLSFLLLPNQNGVASNTVVIVDISNLRCSGASNGLANNANCINLFNISYAWVTNIFMGSWNGITGFGTGGVTPSISVSGTPGGGNVNGVHLNRIITANDGSQIGNPVTIAFEDAYNSSLSHSILNATSTTLSANWSGVQIRGPGQVIDVVDLQTLNFGVNLRLDSTAGGSPLDVKITGSHFDFCGLFCVLLQSGSWVNITNNSFVGEGITGNVGIHTSGSFTSGPNIINDNNFNGFSGAGSNPITFGGTMANTNVIGNQFTNNGANANVTGNGAFVSYGTPTGGHQTYAGSGTAPTLTAGCNGAGSSIVGTDNAGTVTGQTAAATTCTVNFGAAYTANPHCVASGLNSPLTGALTISTTQLIANFASTANYKFSWHCFAP